MYGRTIFTVVVFSLLLSGFRFQVRENLDMGSPAAQSFAKAPNAPRTLLIVDSWLEALPASLQKMKNPEARLSYVKQTVAEIEKLRANQGFQGLRQEIELDFYVEPLKVLTQTPKYHPTHCPEWQHRLVADYAPNETGAIHHPQLKKVQRIIASVCQKN